MEVLRFDASSNVSIGGGCNAASLTAAAVRKRFLELSVAVHPDKNSHPQAEQVAYWFPRTATICFFHFIKHMHPSRQMWKT